MWILTHTALIRMLYSCSVKKHLGMEFCQYINLWFHASSLPCLHMFWHAIPTSLTFLMFWLFQFLFLYSFGTARPNSKKCTVSSVQVNTTPELNWNSIDSLVVIPSKYKQMCNTICHLVPDKGPSTFCTPLCAADFLTFLHMPTDKPLHRFEVKKMLDLKG